MSPGDIVGTTDCGRINIESSDTPLTAMAGILSVMDETGPVRPIKSLHASF